jgi:hypothetical protein
MPRERPTDAWWEPTWQRVVGSTVVLFVVILAFLVGRVRAGADPGLARGATRAVQTAPPATRQQQQLPQQAPSVDPNDPFGQQVDPNAGGGSTDNFGNAVPDQGGGTQDIDPPSTYVS